MKESYLLLYLRTGGGHISAARSIAKNLTKNHSTKIKPILIDGFTETNPLIRKIIEDGYRQSQIKAKWVFEFLYALSKIPIVARFHSCIIAHFVKPYLRKVILKHSPKKIIIFHFFLNKPVLDLLKELGLKIPVITVVTDPYTTPPIWFLNKEQNFIVFSQRAKEYTQSKQIAKDKVHVFPFILDDKFSEKPLQNNTKELKAKYGFNHKKRMILIIGGGDGIPKGKRILKNILKETNSHIEIGVVCGNSKMLFKQAFQLKKQYPNRNLRIFGFIDFVYDLISIADVVITKGGPATIMEILMMQKVPLINSYIWEQEKGNMEFVCKNKMGVYEKEVKRLPKVIDEILEHEKYIEFQENIKKIPLENGTDKVSHFIYSFTKVI